MPNATLPGLVTAKPSTPGFKKEKAKKGYTIASLFSGCGGMDLGFAQEGFEVEWANDFDHWACETFRLNFGDHIVEKSVSDVEGSEVPDCDIILGGFPCQDFSMIWKRGGIKTERGNLYDSSCAWLPQSSRSCLLLKMCAAS